MNCATCKHRTDNKLENSFKCEITEIDYDADTDYYVCKYWEKE